MERRNARRGDGAAENAHALIIRLTGARSRVLTEGEWYGSNNIAPCFERRHFALLRAVQQCRDQERSYLAHWRNHERGSPPVFTIWPQASDQQRQQVRRKYWSVGKCNRGNFYWNNGPTAYRNVVKGPSLQKQR